MKRLLPLLFLFFSLYAAAQDTTNNTLQKDTSVEEKMVSVNIPARYPSGEEAWKKFIGKNVHPSAATDNGAPHLIYQFHFMSQDIRLLKRLH